MPDGLALPLVAAAMGSTASPEELLGMRVKRYRHISSISGRFPVPPVPLSVVDLPPPGTAVPSRETEALSGEPFEAEKAKEENSERP